MTRLARRRKSESEGFAGKAKPTAFASAIQDKANWAPASGAQRATHPGVRGLAADAAVVGVVERSQ